MEGLQPRTVAPPRLRDDDRELLDAAAAAGLTIWAHIYKTVDNDWKSLHSLCRGLGFSQFQANQVVELARPGPDILAFDSLRIKFAHHPLEQAFPLLGGGGGLGREVTTQHWLKLAGLVAHMQLHGARDFTAADLGGYFSAAAERLPLDDSTLAFMCGVPVDLRNSEPWISGKTTVPPLHVLALWLHPDVGSKDLGGKLLPPRARGWDKAVPGCPDETRRAIRWAASQVPVEGREINSDDNLANFDLAAVCEEHLVKVLQNKLLLRADETLEIARKTRGDYWSVVGLKDTLRSGRCGSLTELSCRKVLRLVQFVERLDGLARVEQIPYVLAEVTVSSTTIFKGKEEKEDIALEKGPDYLRWGDLPLGYPSL